MHHRSLLAPLAFVLAACAGDVMTADPDRVCSWPITETATLSKTSGLASGTMAGVCLDSAPPTTADGVQCTVIEAKPASGGCTCDTAAARAPVTDDAAIAAIRANPAAKALELSCLCAIPQLAGSAALACRSDPGSPLLPSGEPVDGFCFAGEDDNPEVTQSCPSAQEIRFVGKGQTSGAPDGAHMVFVLCGEPACGG